MKLTLLTILLFCLIAICQSADEEYADYEDEPAPAPVTSAPAKPTSRLGSLLAPRNRPVVTKKSAQVTSTTAKPVELVEEDPEGEEGYDDKQEEEVPVTTTESSKKLKAGVVRPFRSNDDLLAALKRRRAQVGLSHAKEHASSSTPASVETTSVSKFKSASNGRSRTSGNGEVPSKPTNRGRFGASRGSKPVQEEVEETQQDEVQVKAKPYRRG
ncbi:uncharacterized protein LOC117177400 [Belonocnema kinseyi]|uniref:uncharacterized protein LOC117177400 n=1 Tax=Belonocnema kinseyi TaxID=2817044 RepID=UPI00143DC2BC|nr:uncharacterized protein LOC117177400 [Belonocnema kinseyi]